MIAIVDLLDDDSELEPGKSEKERDLGNIATGFLSVEFDECSPRKTAGLGCGTRTIFLQFVRIGGVDPIRQGSAEIRKRIADGAHLPVKHSNDFCDVIRIENNIVVFVVVVDERSASGGRNVLLHPLGDFFYFRMIVRFGAVVAFDPAADLTFEVALRLAKIGEADSRVVKAVEESEVFHKGLAQPMSFFRRKIETERRISAKDDAVNRFH